ncbi:hypothetical protein [Acinetobacter kyonggiensis]|uniref:Uncharacterized protein n=1 Tax=Acinetobacter kyonggiensis TaxID=595670 RepID=A0A1H3L9D1_9GAMM|nr:hypothetical protein [Acinetobacter kyonggiensis]SDY60886.1 hypothetical protein SAMN05421643_11671 [Acinetobacter kyonggiensis]
MVASTDIKFYVHTNNSAPQLQNVYGSMIDVLNACLVNGIQIGTVSSLTASDSTVTAVFSAPHKLIQYQVIKITGANQAEFNGEHRVLTVPNSTTITFELVTLPEISTATGTISASLPPLGWEKPFSSSHATVGGKAAYRSKNLLLSSRPFLRVVDEPDAAYATTYAKFAKVGIVEDMTDIDALLGVQAPYNSSNPNLNWVGTGSGTSAVNGWARWYYASSTESSNASYSIDYQAPTNGNCTWILVGTGDYFYIIPEVRVGYSAGFIYGFGSVDSLISVDNGNTFLSSTLNAKDASANTHNILRTPLSADNTNYCLLHRNYKNEATYAIANAKSFLSTVYSGYGNILSNDAYSGLSAFDVYALEGSVLRAKFKNIKWLYSNLPYANLTTVSFGEQLFIAKNVAAMNGQIGQVLLKLGDLS